MMNHAHFDIESLESFANELAGDGFVRTKENGSLQIWEGEIHPAFKGMTDAKIMRVGIRNGWPFISPVLFVEGLETNHLTQDGYVCMWRDEEVSREWETLGGFYKRIKEWCSQAKSGWQDDAGLQDDAYLNFHHKSPRVAVFNWKSLGVSFSGWGECHGVVDAETARVDIKPKREWRQERRIDGLWFHAGNLKKRPPRSLLEIESYLTRAQRKRFRRALKSWEMFILLFCWERDGVPNILPILVSAGNGEKPEGRVMVPGPNDEQNLILRAGPNAVNLRGCRATLFGAGALGGHVAVLLAQSGLGVLDIVDDDALLPGNVARHIAGHRLVGRNKAAAVQEVVGERAPWTLSAIHQESPCTPQKIRRRIEHSDIAIDATGNGAFTKSLGAVALEMGKPAVSGALYRGGAVGRVRRHAIPADEPIQLREGLKGYPAIPEGDREKESSSPETGCSAPVNNAPPASVAACASLIALVAIDALVGDFEYEDEVIDVYLPLDKPPFNRIGRVTMSAQAP